MELRDAFATADDLLIVWVMAEAQINERTRVFIDELRLADRVLFVSDPKSRLIRALGILKEDPEPIEQGVPHPTTLLLDRAGTIRFVDVRRDYHFWLDPQQTLETLAALDD